LSSEHGTTKGQKGVTVLATITPNDVAQIVDLIQHVGGTLFYCDNGDNTYSVNFNCGADVTLTDISQEEMDTLLAATAESANRFEVAAISIP
jgi:hypothetical protein